MQVQKRPHPQEKPVLRHVEANRVKLTLRSRSARFSGMTLFMLQLRNPSLPFAMSYYLIDHKKVLKIVQNDMLYMLMFDL